jgi:hypothetical protein
MLKIRKVAAIITLMMTPSAYAGTSAEVLTACINYKPPSQFSISNPEGHKMVCNCIVEGVEQYNSAKNTDIGDYVIARFQGKKPVPNENETSETALENLMVAGTLVDMGYLGCKQKVPLKYLQ